MRGVERAYAFQFFIENSIDALLLQYVGWPNIAKDSTSRVTSNETYPNESCGSDNGSAGAPRREFDNHPMNAGGQVLSNTLQFLTELDSTGMQPRSTLGAAYTKVIFHRCITLASNSLCVQTLGISKDTIPHHVRHLGP